LHVLFDALGGLLGHRRRRLLDPVLAECTGAAEDAGADASALALDRELRLGQLHLLSRQPAALLGELLHELDQRCV